jgi:4a-hydroxytetrahydrobiopterin dehydratase
MSDLAQKKCTPCQGGVAPLRGNAVSILAEKLGCHWQIINEHHLEKTFEFKNFQLALQFTNSVGKIAESEGHHPDIYLSWGKVKVTLWTHKIDGLSENDFILAAKIDGIQPN